MSRISVSLDSGIIIVIQNLYIKKKNEFSEQTAEVSKSYWWRQSLMSSLIFCFWRDTDLTFLKNDLKLLKDKGLEIIPKYGKLKPNLD